MDSFDVGTGDDDVPLISEATTDNRKKMTVRLLSGAIAIVFVVVVVSVGVSTSHHKESTEANTEFIDGTCYENNDFHLGRDFLPLNDFHESVTNTPDECIRTCRGYSYAGVQNKKECFCGNYEPPASRIKDSSECDAKCPGNASFTCGGDWRMNIYSTVKTDDFINGACYEDCIDGRQIMAGCGRILEGFLQTYSQITVEKCKAICQDKGFLFAGLEEESWCGCGNEVPAGHEKPGECNMACNGDSGQICGDTSRINIYRTSTIVSTVWSKGLRNLRPTLGSESEAGTLDDVSLKLSGGVNAQTCKTGVIWSIRDWKKSLLNNIAYKDTDHDFGDCGDFEADGSPIGFTIVKPGNDSLKLVNMEFDIGGEIYVWSGAAWWDPTHPVLMATWQDSRPCTFQSDCPGNKAKCQRGKCVTPSVFDFECSSASDCYDKPKTQCQRLKCVTPSYFNFECSVASDCYDKPKTQCQFGVIYPNCVTPSDPNFICVHSSDCYDKPKTKCQYDKCVTPSDLHFECSVASDCYDEPKMQCQLGKCVTSSDTTSNVTSVRTATMGLTAVSQDVLPTDSDGENRQHLV